MKAAIINTHPGTTFGEWVITENKDDILACDDPIFVETIDELRVELEMRHPAPAGCSFIENAWSGHLRVSDFPIVSSSNEDEVMRVVQEVGQPVKITRLLSWMEGQSISINGDFIYNPSNHLCEYNPEKARKLVVKKAKTVASKKKNGDVSIADLKSICVILFDVWQNIPGFKYFDIGHGLCTGGRQSWRTECPYVHHSVGSKEYQMLLIMNMARNIGLIKRRKYQNESFKNLISELAVCADALKRRDGIMKRFGFWIQAQASSMGLQDAP